MCRLSSDNGFVPVPLVKAAFDFLSLHDSSMNQSFVSRVKDLLVASGYEEIAYTSLSTGTESLVGFISEIYENPEKAAPVEDVPTAVEEEDEPMSSAVEETPAEPENMIEPEVDEGMNKE